MKKARKEEKNEESRERLKFQQKKKLYFLIIFLF
jgi:hypothetical protein